MKIIVVGAGISGLSAAWTLHQAGAEVVVLESSDRPGGRMRSVELAGTVAELGAQFLSSAYTVVPQLARERGLVLNPVSPGGAVLRAGRLRAFRSDRPLSFFTGGVVPWSAAPRAAHGLTRLRAAVDGRASNDLAAFIDLDDTDGLTWARRTLGTPMAEHFLAASVNGFYFLSLAASGGPLAAAVAGFGARPASTLTVPGGLGRLPAALAEALDVRYGHRVTALEAAGDGVVVSANDEHRWADRVVLALPGPDALALNPCLGADQVALMSTPYSSGIVAHLVYDEPLPAVVLAKAYGVLVHPGEPTPVAAMAVASRAQLGGAGGDVLTVMTTDATAREWCDVADDDVLVRLEEAVRVIAPRLPVRVDGHVQRWAAAMPTVPPGQAGRVAAYRRTVSPDTRVVLAGDYLGLPWTDSAAATGRWAADALLSSRSPVSA